jgi:hypothetical protein
MKSNNKIRGVLLVCLLLFLLSSCHTVEYLYKYQTYVEPGHNNDLKYSDSLLRFQFIPAPNGIQFTIENLTSSNLFLIWDKSYIIFPDGNSHKLLNTDILKTDQKLVDKENNESIIPSKSKFIRFTTSISNISYFENINTLSLYNSLINTLSTLALYNEIYTYGAYWPISAKSKYASPEKLNLLNGSEYDKMKAYLQTSDNLGIGFTFKKGAEYIEYHFKIKIRSISIYYKTETTFILLREVSRVD